MPRSPKSGRTYDRELSIPQDLKEEGLDLDKANDWQDWYDLGRDNGIVGKGVPWALFLTKFVKDRPSRKWVERERGKTLSTEAKKRVLEPIIQTVRDMTSARHNSVCEMIDSYISGLAFLRAQVYEIESELGYKDGVKPKEDKKKESDK